MDELVKLALESVETEEQAEQVVNGNLEDAYLLKLRIDVDVRPGVVLALVSIMKREIIELYSVFCDSSLIKKIHSFEDQNQITYDLAEAYKNSSPDTPLSQTIGRMIYRNMNRSLLNSYFPQWEIGDVNGVINFLENSVKSLLKIQRIIIKADIEKVSSVIFRKKNPMVGIIYPIQKPAIEEQSDLGSGSKVVATELSALEKQIDKYRKSYSRVINCKTLVSPVYGLRFDDLKKGIKLYFSLPISTKQEKNMARSIGGIDKTGNAVPVVGEYLGMVTDKKEFHIFGKGPFDVLLHAVEQREVKIATPDITKSVPDKFQSVQSIYSGSNLVSYSIAIGVVIVLGVVGFLLLSLL